MKKHLTARAAAIALRESAVCHAEVERDQQYDNRIRPP
jgi:hypothetical protein